MAKYKNKDGIELNYTQKGDGHTDLVKEVVREAVKILSLYDMNCKISMNMAMGNCKKFLKENFDLDFVHPNDRLNNEVNKNERK